MDSGNNEWDTAHAAGIEYKDFVWQTKCESPGLRLEKESARAPDEVKVP